MYIFIWKQFQDNYILLCTIFTNKNQTKKKSGAALHTWKFSRDCCEAATWLSNGSDTGSVQISDVHISLHTSCKSFLGTGTLVLI